MLLDLWRRFRNHSISTPDASIQETSIQEVQVPTSEPVQQGEQIESIKLTPSQCASYMDLFLRLLDSIFLLDRENYSILETNDSCERLLGFNSEETKGKSFSDFVVPEQRVDLEKQLRVARRKYYPLEFETQVKTQSGAILTLNLSACSLKLNDEREILQVIAKDITLEKAAQEKIKVHTAQLEVLNKKLEELSVTDELTGLSNKRHFKRKLREEHIRSRRYHNVYCVVMLDIDNFKHYNDRNGHPAGDRLLHELSALLKEQFRTSDLVARYGGEEFIILCPETACEPAMIAAERCRKAIESHPFEHAAHQPLGKISASMGVASFPEWGKSFEDIISAADQALYHSKKTGRNRVTSYLQFKEFEQANEKKAS